MNQSLTLQSTDLNLAQHILWKLMLVPIESAFNLPEDTLTFSHTHIQILYICFFFFFATTCPVETQLPLFLHLAR